MTQPPPPPAVAQPGLIWLEANELEEMLHEADENPRRISDEAKERLRYSLDNAPNMGKARPIISTLEGKVVAGNMRLRVCKEDERGHWVFFEDLNPAEQREWMLRDNNPYGEYVPEDLAALIAQHEAEGGDMALLGFGDDELDDLRALNAGGEDAGGLGAAAGAGSLAERFIIPPFTVIDMRRGEWRERKRNWIEKLPKSSAGRTDLEDTPFQAVSSGDPQFYEQKRRLEAELGRDLTTAEYLADHYVDPRGDESSLDDSQTSIFDPALCEVVYRWFSTQGDLVLDPFAGGSVRGLVAGMLERDYVGVDLRPEQVEANRQHADDMVGPDMELDCVPVWVEGDAVQLHDSLGAAGAPVKDGYDLVFSCPPYFNLEVYSDDKRDLSRAKDYGHFGTGYQYAIQQAVESLHDDRFLCWVVGDFRDKKGRLVPFVADTIRWFEAAGASLYNTSIMVTQIGSVRILAAKQFVASRKLGRTHQYLLTFVKGDPKKATERLGDVDADALIAATESEAL